MSCNPWFQLEGLCPQPVPHSNPWWVTWAVVVGVLALVAAVCVLAYHLRWQRRRR